MSVLRSICLSALLLTVALTLTYEPSVSTPPNSIVLPMTDSLYREFTEYIRHQSDSDTAFKALQNLSQSDQMGRRWGRAAYSLDFNQKHFYKEEHLSWISQRRAYLLGNMMATSAQGEDLKYYDYFATRLAPTDTGFVIMRRMLEPYFNGRHWDDAKRQINNFASLYPERREYLSELLRISSAPTEGLEPAPVKGVNTKSAEWDPNPTPTGRYMFYTFRAPNKLDADVALAKKSDSGYVYIGVLKGPLSGSGEQTIDNISYNTDNILISGGLEGTLGRFDIYMASRNGNEYSEIFHFPEPINSPYHDEGATISVDEQVLIFTSDRPEGTGDHHPQGKLHMGSADGSMDLYVAFKDSTGKWGNPINMGPTINTEMAERSPYLHPDGKTLYFSSNGHPGLGELDVFKSERLDDSWTNWSKPVNLGKEINTIQSDWGYKIGLTGDTAYFSAKNRTIGTGDYDIFTVKMPSTARPDSLVLVEGAVFDENSKARINALLRWEERSAGKLRGELNVSSAENYLLPLRAGESYGIYVNADGYLPYAGELDLDEVAKGTRLMQQVFLVPVSSIEEERAFRASNIFFDYNKSTIREESATELNNLADFLKKNQNITLTVAGHTDEAGTSKYNQRLSENRAVAVKQYLVNLGLSPKRIISLGFGESKPITKDKAKSQMNRRVEFYFSK